MDLSLDGQQVTFLIGAHAHQLSKAFTFTVRSETRAQINAAWTRLIPRRRGSRLRLARGQVRRLLADWAGEVNRTAHPPAATRALMKRMRLDIATLKAAAAQPQQERKSTEHGDGSRLYAVPSWRARRMKRLPRISYSPLATRPIDSE
jgi:hypothetical protein